jgi:uncharacterized protein with PIN domain
MEFKMNKKPICETGCDLYKDYKDCPLNNTVVENKFHLIGKCKVISEQVERESQERMEKREIEEKTCPECGSTNTKIVRSIPQGEIRYGGHNYCTHIRQCKKCKTVW